MIEIIDKMTTIYIMPKDINKGLSLDMLHKINLIGKCNKFSPEAEAKIQECNVRIQEVLKQEVTNWDELDRIRDEITDIKVKDHKGYGFNLHLNLCRELDNSNYCLQLIDRIATDEELKYIIDKIIEISEGIELDIEVEHYGN